MSVTDMSTPMTDDVVPPKASLWRVVKDQRKIGMVALGLMVASFWIIGQLGEWRLAACIAVGVGFGLVNHLATEYWLLKLISSGAQPTRNQMIVSTIVRLTVLTVLAIGSLCSSGPTASGCCSAWPSSDSSPW